MVAHMGLATPVDGPTSVIFARVHRDTNVLLGVEFAFSALARVVATLNVGNTDGRTVSTTLACVAKAWVLVVLLVIVTILVI
jgi:hypothetical protein